MMNKTPARTPISTVVIVGAVVLSLMLSACGAGAVTPATATITAPATNAQFQGGDEVKIEGKVNGSTVKKVDIYVNGAKFATIDKATQPNEFAVSVVWTAPADIAGSSVIQLKGLDDKDQAVVSSEAVFITVQAPPTPTPAPTAVPTSVPTAAPPEPTVAPAAAVVSPTVSPVLASPRPENDLLNVRALPDINAQKLGQLNKGQSAPVLGKNADATWFQVTFPGAPGNVGWVFAAVTQITGTTTALPVVQPGATVTSTTSTTGTVALPTIAPATTSTVAAPAGLTAPFVKLKAGQDFANVRNGPDVAYQRVGQIDTTNSAATVKGKNAAGTWFQIAFASAPGGVAWVYGLLVDFTGDVSKVAVATAPPLPTAAAPAATAVPAATAPPAAPAATTAPALPPSALLPYSQSDSFQPRNDIGDVPLGINGEARSSKWTWVINGAKSAELEITSSPGPGIFSNCPAGNLASIQPNSAAGKRIPVSLPSGSFDFTIADKGYYLFTLYIVKSDGSTTTIPRNVIVDCFKSQ